MPRFRATIESFGNTELLDIIAPRYTMALEVAQEHVRNSRLVTATITDLEELKKEKGPSNDAG